MVKKEEGMRVIDLIDALREVEDENMIVILSSDPEGSSYHPLRDTDICVYDSEEREVGIASLDEEAIEAGYGEEDVMTDGVGAFCLWP